MKSFLLVVANLQDDGCRNNNPGFLYQSRGQREIPLPLYIPCQMEAPLQAEVVCNFRRRASHFTKSECTLCISCQRMLLYPINSVVGFIFSSSQYGTCLCSCLECQRQLRLVLWMAYDYLMKGLFDFHLQLIYLLIWDRYQLRMCIKIGHQAQFLKSHLFHEQHLKWTQATSKVLMYDCIQILSK